MINNKGKQPIKIPSEKSVVVFCVFVLIIVLCGILGYKN
jgi:hypothetical protein